MAGEAPPQYRFAMPIVTIQSLRPPEPGRIDMMLSSVVNSLSRAIGCPPADVWVYWQEAGAVHQGQTRREFAGHCPMVTIRARTANAPEQVEKGLSATAEAVSISLDVPVENVWIYWQELSPTRVFAGGHIR